MVVTRTLTSPQSLSAWKWDLIAEITSSNKAQVRAIANRVDAMHVVFNVSHEDQGQRNSLTLMRLLAEV